jgi:hypothetical protein
VLEFVAEYRRRAGLDVEPHPPIVTADGAAAKED